MCWPAAGVLEKVNIYVDQHALELIDSRTHSYCTMLIHSFDCDIRRGLVSVIEQYVTATKPLILTLLLPLLTPKPDLPSASIYRRETTGAMSMCVDV